MVRFQGRGPRILARVQGNANPVHACCHASGTPIRTLRFRFRLRNTYHRLSPFRYPGLAVNIPNALLGHSDPRLFYLDESTLVSGPLHLTFPFSQEACFVY